MMDNFDLTPLSQITDRQGYRISGFTSGSADMAAALGRGVLYANIAFDDIRVNDIPMRNTVFRSKWDFNAQRALFELADRQQQTPIVQGYYQPSERYYRADVQLDSIDLALLDPVLKGAIRDSRGTANAALRLESRGAHAVRRADRRPVVPYDGGLYECALYARLVGDRRPVERDDDAASPRCATRRDIRPDSG
ncbi:MAG: hypothetical protein ACLR8Y_00495 [Alistipes indistinctus]